MDVVRREVMALADPRIKIPLEGKCVKRYELDGCVAEIWDGAFAGKTEEELEAIRWNARRIACEIIDRARARGEVV